MRVPYFRKPPMLTRATDLGSRFREFGVYGSGVEGLGLRVDGLLIYPNMELIGTLQKVRFWHVKAT